MKYMETIVEDKQEYNKLLCNKLLCDKYAVKLFNTNKRHEYSIRFNCCNDNYDLSKLLNYNLYKLLAELNPDLIEKIEITTDELNSNNKNILFMFKSPGQGLGMLNKYMHVTTHQEIYDKKIIFRSTDTNKKVELPKNYEKVTCNYSELTITVNSIHNIDFVYDFHIDLHEDLPKYMENLVGYMMKKLLYKLKIFIEKIG